MQHGPSPSGIKQLNLNFTAKLSLPNCSCAPSQFFFLPLQCDALLKHAATTCLVCVFCLLAACMTLLAQCRHAGTKKGVLHPATGVPQETSIIQTRTSQHTNNNRIQQTISDNGFLRSACSSISTQVITDQLKKL